QTAPQPGSSTNALPVKNRSVAKDTTVPTLPATKVTTQKFLHLPFLRQTFSRQSAPSSKGQDLDSLSDLTLIYCGKADYGHLSRSFLLNRTTIRLKRAQKLPQNGLSLATTGQARQAASLRFEAPPA
ncbi:hypothetical protein, partial [Marinobacterium rhizophilum]|uniref:hypothetical protein n=1 Tax=Marinobacterium rhizophilum TaxID=420402 RepID=UPI001969E5CF